MRARSHSPQASPLVMSTHAMASASVGNTYARDETNPGSSPSCIVGPLRTAPSSSLSSGPPPSTAPQDLSPGVQLSPLENSVHPSGKSAGCSTAALARALVAWSASSRGAAVVVVASVVVGAVVVVGTVVVEFCSAALPSSPPPHATSGRSATATAAIAMRMGRRRHVGRGQVFDIDSVPSSVAGASRTTVTKVPIGGAITTPWSW